MQRTFLLKKLYVSSIILSEGSTAEISIEEDHGNIQAENEKVDEINREFRSIITAETETEVDEETAKAKNISNNENEAPISERAASSFSPIIGSPRVQFEKIKEEDASSTQTMEVPTGTTPSGHEEDRNRRRHQKHEHK